MAYEIRAVDYFYTTATNQPGEGYELLETLASMHVDLLAFTAIPVAPMHTHLTIFPEEAGRLRAEAARAGLKLDGPHPALLVTGEDEMGILAQIHRKLYDAGVNVYAATGVAAGSGRFGCILYVRRDEYARAIAALKV